MRILSLPPPLTLNLHEPKERGSYTSREGGSLMLSPQLTSKINLRYMKLMKYLITSRRDEKSGDVSTTDFEPA
jgi:hypothetical protein